MAGPDHHSLLVIDELDEETQLAEVEDLQGRTYQLPAEWLPAATDGAAYRVTMSGTANESTITFTPDQSAARQLRERSKQTLLDFADTPKTEDATPEERA